MTELFDIDKHYSRKEKSIFPFNGKNMVLKLRHKLCGVLVMKFADLKAFHLAAQDKTSKNLAETFIALQNELKT